MRAAKPVIILGLLIFAMVGGVQGQTLNLADQQKAPTVQGGTGLFNTFSTRSLCRGEFNLAVFWNNFDRDPGDLDINQIPFNFTLGLTDRWEVWVDWITWQQTTSRNPFLLSGYQYSATRFFGDPVVLLGPPIGGNGGAAFYPGTGALYGGILPAVGRFGTPINFTTVGAISPGGSNASPVIGLSPAIISDLPGFYNDLPFFGEVDFIGFDGLGRSVVGSRQSSNGSGDVYLGSKYSLRDANTHWFSIAVGGYVKLPISRTDSARARGRTNGEFEYGPILMFGQESSSKRFRLYENVGYIHTGDIEKAGVKALDLQDKLLLNVGLSIAINRHVEVIADLSHTRFVGGGTPSLFRSNPTDLTLGMRFYLKDGAISFGGAYRYNLSNIGDKTLQVLECFEVPGEKPDDWGDHDCEAWNPDCHPPKPPKPRIECRPKEQRFEDRGDRHGFLGFFSVGNRKQCPPLPVPSCSIETSAAQVNRGDRLVLTTNPTTPGYNDNKVAYEYRWDVRDALGRPVALSGAGASVEVPTARLACGSYSVTTSVTASISEVDCPSDCPNSGQTTCTTSFEVTEPPCPTITCDINASPAEVVAGERVSLRVRGAGASNLSYRWSTTGGRLSSDTGTDVTLNTTGVSGRVTVRVDASTDRTRCDQPCPGGSCSVTVSVLQPPVEKPPVIPCGPIFFPFNSSRINNEHKACLDEVALRLQQDPRSQLVIDGHRDSSERVGISLTRANNSSDYLVNERLVDRSRITIRNFGDTCPQELGDPKLNRRVEFWILPEGTSIDAIQQLKTCAPGSSPRVLFGEQPAPLDTSRPPGRAPRRRRPEPIPEPVLRLEDNSSASSSRTVTTGGASGVSLKPATVISAVRTQISGGVLRIFIDADGQARFKAFSLAEPSRIVVDVLGVTHNFGSKSIDIDAASVERVRVGSPGGDVVRIVVDLSAKVTCQVAEDGKTLVIIVGDPSLVSRLNTPNAAQVITSR